MSWRDISVKTAERARDEALPDREVLVPPGRTGTVSDLGGKLIAAVTDADGNVIGLIQVVP